MEGSEKLHSKASCNFQDQIPEGMFRGKNANLNAAMYLRIGSFTSAAQRRRCDRKTIAISISKQISETLYLR